MRFSAHCFSHCCLRTPAAARTRLQESLRVRRGRWQPSTRYGTLPPCNCIFSLMVVIVVVVVVVVVVVGAGGGDGCGSGEC